jgi:TRAP transporter TAXI family solute receptor
MIGILAEQPCGAAGRRGVCVVAAALLLAGCGAPPDAAQLKTDLEGALVAAAPPGLLAVQDVAIAASDRDGSRRAVAFIAHLRVNRDHGFGAWDQFNAAALAGLLGAAPRAVRGIAPRLNAAGDVLTVPGRAIYAPAANGKGWTLAAFGPPVAPQDDRRLRLREQAWLMAVTLLTQPESWRIVRDNLAWAISRSRGQLARRNGGYALAGGPIGSDGWSVIEALRLSDETRRPVVNLATRDGADLLSMLRDGAATAAIVDSDRVAAAEIANLRAVAALYPKPLHVLVPAASAAASVADLRGKRIAIVNGPSRAAEDALRAHRLPAAAVANLVPLTLAEALGGLRAGKLDAAVFAARAPVALPAALAGTFRLLGLDSDAIALLTTGEMRYVAVKIPGRTYPGQPNPVVTIAVIATLVAPLSVPDAEIGALLKSLFGPVDYLGAGSIAGTMIAPATALTGLTLTLPLHPGSETYFRNAPAER